MKDKFLFGAWEHPAPRLWKRIYKNKYWLNRKPRKKWFPNVLKAPELDFYGEGISLPSQDQLEVISNLSAVFGYFTRCYKTRTRYFYMLDSLRKAAA